MLFVFQQLGIPHPPGYPLFIILSHLFMKLPMIRLHFSDEWNIMVSTDPSPGWKVNNMCAILSALTAVLIAKSSWLILGSFGMSSSSLHRRGTVLVTTAAFLFSLSPISLFFSSLSIH
jgi:hypothetical protein